MKIIGSKLRRRLSSIHPPTEQKKKALLIGIKYDTSGSPVSQEFGQLDEPHKDVTSVRDLLIDVYEYAPENVVVLIDGEGRDRKVQPTKVNMTREIQRLVQDVNPGDHLVFLFAGHSTQFTCSDRTEDDDKDEAIVPMDHSGNSKKSKLILDNWLRKHLIDPLKPGVQLIAILDACHSARAAYRTDLDHNECNRVAIPWVNPGLRLNDTMHERVVRRDDTMIHSTSVVRFSPAPSRSASLDAILARMAQQQPKLSRSPTFTFFRSRTASSAELGRGRLARPPAGGEAAGERPEGGASDQHPEVQVAGVDEEVRRDV
ncbi:hypothetical protein EVJ58_g1158 [Rhodofomes roseus]|uniref:Peptidase C14 caspase domain-containing protein n=1 Tax=Rhodofomes roseus TaxID=34475 RepID=A0A4Y9Z2V1_9APHY|nr:hypothetical protein EVJ58_g1158 [Rhodofomes roseus]